MARLAKAASIQKGKISAADKAKRLEVEKALRGADDKLAAPEYLDESQKQIFQFILSSMKETNLVGNLDVYILSLCSIAIGRLQQIETMISNDTSLLSNSALMSSKDKYSKDFYKCCAELCLSPSSRARLGSLAQQKKTEKEDPLLALLAKHNNRNS